MHAKDLLSSLPQATNGIAGDGTKETCGALRGIGAGMIETAEAPTHTVKRSLVRTRCASHTIGIIATPAIQCSNKPSPDSGRLRAFPSTSSPLERQELVFRQGLFGQTVEPILQPLCPGDDVLLVANRAITVAKFHAMGSFLQPIKDCWRST